jgi:hypothetical protein
LIGLPAKRTTALFQSETVSSKFMKTGTSCFYVLKDGPHKGELRSAIITRAVPVKEDYATDKLDADKKPIFGTRDAFVVDVTFFPSMTDGFGAPAQWRRDLQVNKSENGAPKWDTVVVDETVNKEKPAPAPKTEKPAKPAPAPKTEKPADEKK